MSRRRRKSAQRPRFPICYSCKHRTHPDMTEYGIIHYQGFVCDLNALTTELFDALDTECKYYEKRPNPFEGMSKEDQLEAVLEKIRKLAE